MEPGYEVVIGLEVHLQLRTRTKMFCACPAGVGGEPNSRTCPVCLGLPGAMPVLNGEAVRMALALGLALDARIRPRSLFYRKQYFYPDLPKGYQITQGPVAVVEDGALAIPGDPAVRGAEGEIRAGILRAHLEEDAGKNLHGEGATLVDLNRAGVPLLEVVGAPDLRSPQEASDCLKALHRLVTFLGICDGNLEEGSFRCDANLSLRRPGAALGTRVEIKNLNSFNFVKRALAFEAERQAAILDAGGTVAPETRGWDAASGRTRSQRGKEAALDYRYFPEPDLPPLTVAEAEVEAVRATLPELPWVRQARWREAHGLSAHEAGLLAQDPDFAGYFEALAAASGLGRAAAHWMIGPVSRLLNARGGGVRALGLAPERLAELLRLVEAGDLNLNDAKDTVLPELLAGPESARAVVARLGLGVLRDGADLEALVQRVLDANPAAVAQALAGKASLVGHFVGEVRRASGGKADPKAVQAILARKLTAGPGPD